MIKTKISKKRFIVDAVLLVVALIALIWCYFYIQKRLELKNMLVTCTSSETAMPQKYSGWKTTIYSMPLSFDAVGDKAADNGVRSFSIKALKGMTSQNSIYFHVQKNDNSYIDGTKAVIEVCDDNNKTPNYGTTATTTLKASSKNSTNFYIYLQGRTYLPTKPGDYRVDAYLYTDNAWHLTDRMKIKLTI